MALPEPQDLPERREPMRNTAHVRNVRMAKDLAKANTQASSQVPRLELEPVQLDKHMLAVIEVEKKPKNW